MTIANSNDGSLTQKTKLTAISQVLQQVARLVVGFFVTPILTRGLGPELFGAWNMIQQSMGYFSLSDFRPMGTLKFSLSLRQHVDDYEEKRRQIGAAILLWVFTFPIYLIVGFFVIWKANVYIHVAASNAKTLQIAIAIVMASILVDRIVSLPGTVLRGMNLDYRAMGLNAVVVLINGGLVVLAVFMHLGLPGVAGASMLGIIIAGAVRLVIARKSLVWFGVSRPKKAEVVGFVKLSSWFTFSTLGNLLVTASDILLVGILLGPAASAVYAAMGMVLKMVADPLQQIVFSANAGIIGVCGQKDWERVRKMREELYLTTFPFIFVIASCIIVMNKAFITLWLGSGYFDCQVTNVLLVFTAVFKIFYYIDVLFISAALELKKMTYSMFIGGVITIVMGCILVKWWGIPGMAFTILVAYLLQWIYYQKILHDKIGTSVGGIIRKLVRPILFIIPLIGGMSYVIGKVHPSTWMSFGITAIGISSFAAVFVWFAVVTPNERKIMKARLNAIL